jgi:hypothetical protein
MPKEKEGVYLIVTIDVEEDDWGVYKPAGHHLTNIRFLRELQKLFDSYKIRPTYLIDYPVAADETHREFFKALHSSGRAEIGAHLHPWNTPPFEEKPSEYNSMMKNLPHDLQKRKMVTLTDMIERNLGIRPVSFRAGRFGLDEQAVSILVELGYLVDTSVTPFVDWETHYGGINFQNYPYYPYRIAPHKEINRHQEDGKLWEVPITIGFNRTPFNSYSSIYNFLGRDELRLFRLRGLADKVGLLKRMWLSPEVSGFKEMQKLSKITFGLGITVLNMFFHSISLAPGLSPFVKTNGQKKAFLKNIDLYLSWLQEKYNLRSLPLSDYFQIASECDDANRLKTQNTLVDPSYEL